jgi:glucarate dehydratase
MIKGAGPGPGPLIITTVTVTPVAFPDPPLLNTFGAHESLALRSIVELRTDAGLVGIGETFGDQEHLDMLERIRPTVVGGDAFDLDGLRARIRRLLGDDRYPDWTGIEGATTVEGTVDRIIAGIEVACLDVQGKALGRSVAELLGGPVREQVPYTGYLFYKWAGHPGQPDDGWGPALDASGIVDQARTLVERHGFRALKLKGGVLPPLAEAETILALRDAFPGYPLRLDPNGAWTVATAIDIGRRLEGDLEYLEDPTIGVAGMARVAASVPMPLATNMIVISPDQLPEALAARAIAIVLADHHLWGGLVRTRRAADVCDFFDLGLSMHSNSHLGISLAAMTHLAAATPNLTYACDTHWPWIDPADDLIQQPLPFIDGAIAVPRGPGLGVELDRDALARLHERYRRSDIRTRDDTSYRRRFEPDFRAVSPRW